MKNMKLEENGVMAVDMQMPAPADIQVSLTIRDELDFPIQRRGFRTIIPYDDQSKADVAKKIGEVMERTARFTMGLSIEEEEGK